MYKCYTVNLICSQCPEDMTPQTCPLRKYTEEQSALLDKGLFHISVNENHLVPHGGRETLIKMYDEMHAICEKCQQEHCEKEH